MKIFLMKFKFVTIQALKLNAQLALYLNINQV